MTPTRSAPIPIQNRSHKSQEAVQKQLCLLKQGRVEKKNAVATSPLPRVSILISPSLSPQVVLPSLPSGVQADPATPCLPPDHHPPLCPSPPQPRTKYSQKSSSSSSSLTTVTEPMGTFPPKVVWKSATALCTKRSTARSSS